LIAHWMYN